MEKVKKIIIRVTDKLEESCVLGAIRQAMIMMIPLLVVGYMSAMFLNLPIPAYQTFITTLFGGRVTEVLQCVYLTVNDFFSVFLVVATSVSYSIIKQKKQGIYEGTGNIIILVIISLAAFAGYSGIQYDDFSITKFSNMYAFSALLVSLVSSEMYCVLKNSGLFRLKKQRTNTDSVYEEAIEEILQKGKVPIIVGGTGLYANSLIYNIEYNEIMLDEEYRKNLMKISETEAGLATLYEKARRIDPVAMEKISSNDKKRIIRVLEIKHSTGKNKTELELESRKNEVKYEYKVFAINMPREILYDRINKRVDIMIENGLIDEVENIIEKYKEFPTAMQAIGYKEIVMYLKGELTKQEAIEKIKQESRRYAKRQITWFKKIENIKWIDGLKDKDENIKFIQDVIFALKKECD